VAGGVRCARPGSNLPEKTHRESVAESVSIIFLPRFKKNPRRKKRRGISFVPTLVSATGAPSPPCTLYIISPQLGFMNPSSESYPLCREYMRRGTCVSRDIVLFYGVLSSIYIVVF
jgi:hypothetical protein